MDKNSITGFVLIAVILGAFYFINKPSEEELNEIKRQQDSIAMVQLEKDYEASKASSQRRLPAEVVAVSDSAKKVSLANQYGEFAELLDGEERLITLENDLVKIVFTNKGGKIYSVDLKKYLTHDKKPLILFEGDEMDFSFNFFSSSNRQISTKDIFFESIAASKSILVTKSPESVTFRAKVAGDKYIEFTYTLAPDSYTLDYQFNTAGLEELLPRSVNAFDLVWNMKMRQNEKGRDFESRYSGLYYKFFEDEVENLSGSKSDDETLTTKVKWIGYKDQFFSSVLIADKYFSGADVAQIKPEDDTDPYLLNFSSNIAVPIQDEAIDFKFYFGPNHYKTLKRTGYDLENLINLGWVGVNLVNKYLVIGVFNFLSTRIANYGLIILLLTIFIKLIVFPFTYKSYISTAKMRVLKPQIDAINEKIPKDKAMERQQATMALYKKVGVNPMGGCLPMLFQFPVLVAMFYFFPASIELRQESFLWATDLASYDSIVSWDTHIPFISEFYGNHVSLFCILMAITNVVYTKLNSQMTASTSAMPGMQTMMYLMPLMFLFIFNKYSAGLSYYYFISTLITVGQTFLMRRFVNEEALLAKIESNKKKPTKTSKFQERITKMQKQQKAQLKDRANKK